MQIQFFEGNAFTGTSENPLQQMPIGNPALICFHDTLFTDKEMSKIASLAQSPMTAFIARGAHEMAYAVRYYSPNGLEVDLCGHATLVSTYFLKNFIQNARSYDISLNPAYLSGNNVLIGMAWSDGIGMQTTFYQSAEIDLKANIGIVTAALDVSPQDISRIYQTELNDIVFV